MKLLKTLLITSLLLTPALLAAQSTAARKPTLLDKISLKGGLFFQGFYLARDLPTEKSTTPVCPGVTTDRVGNSRCREEEDFYRMRFRLDAAIRPNKYVDIIYGLEVGYLTFGRDDTSKTGPSTGGQGSGRTNLETRELRLKLKNTQETLVGNLGLFSVSTPKGIVLASSGAGAQLLLDWRSMNSRFELTNIRSIDVSNVDDSNGFNDDNYEDINLGVAKWKFTGVRGLYSELYGVIRQDDNPSADDISDTTEETSRIYWLGLYLRFKFGPLKVVLHGVGNFGTFHRPLESSKELYPGLSMSTVLTGLGVTATTGLRKQQRVAAGAGQMEISYDLTNRLKLVGAAAAGSGRLGDEPDGSSNAFRRDQFRTAGSAFQMSDITLDSSGGYTLISGGALTGIVEKGILLKARLFSNITVDVGYFVVDLYRTPTISSNIFYVQYLNTDKPTNRYGEEWNAHFKWQILSDLTMKVRVAYFNAGQGYKILNDVEYGDRMFESAFSIHQKF